VESITVRSIDFLACIDFARQRPRSPKEVAVEKNLSTPPQQPQPGALEVRFEPFSPERVCSNCVTFAILVPKVTSPLRLLVSRGNPLGLQRTGHPASIHGYRVPGLLVCTNHRSTCVESRCHTSDSAKSSAVCNPASRRCKD
jgi:hypothetical protein